MSTHAVTFGLVSQVGVLVHRTFIAEATERVEALDTAMAEALVYARRTGRAVAYPTAIDGEDLDPEEPWGEFE